MEKTRLGRTGLLVSRTGFGALPIQRVSFDHAKEILQKAYDSGIDLFDTARAYSDSEEKMGYALSDVRKQIIIATKTTAEDRKTLFEQLETSLRNLRTDHIDIYQLHNPKGLPDPADPESVYGGLLEAKRKGMIRFIGITNHSIRTAMDAVESGLFDTVQFPLNHLSSDMDLELIQACSEHDIGVLAMKGMSGGLIKRACVPFAFLRQYGNVVPLWGVQRLSELEEFIRLEDDPPAMDKNMQEAIDQEKRELAGDFCRGCGYCLPCGAGIDIPIAARMSLLLERAPYKVFLVKKRRENMLRIHDCIECGECKSRCPYGLDTPGLLRRELEKYETFYQKHRSEAE